MDNNLLVLENEDLDNLMNFSVQPEIIEVEQINNFEEGETIMHHFDEELECDLEAGIIEVKMDIREPLSTFKRILETQLNKDLSGFMFSLQGNTLVESSKNLVDMCILSEGVVQIHANISLETKRINIIDVLKPSQPPTGPIKWGIDENFKLEQTRLGIPSNPEEWDAVHVKHWIQWAVRHFNIPNVKLSDWAMTGKELCALSKSDIQKMVPVDPDNIFCVHFELLKNHKVVAGLNNDDESTSQLDMPRNTSIVPGFRSGNNGQVQLWQFLLELLTSPEYQDAIHWIEGTDAEFIFSKPSLVAELWGQTKKRRRMNYEKLSRAMRYYYLYNMIAKVHGKRFTYKFVCDLKKIIGYSAQELMNLVKYNNPNPTFKN